MLFSIGTVLSSYVHQIKHDGVSGVTCNSLDSFVTRSGDGFGPSKFAFDPECVMSPIVITA